jgi:hypothetical protein
MPDAVPETITRKPKLYLWLAIAALFFVASCVQILLYGAPTLLGLGGHHFPHWLYEPVVLVFFFAPAVVALIYSLRLLRSAARHAGRGLGVWSVVTVALLAIVSAYIGVFVSLNTWGT